MLLKIKLYVLMVKQIILKAKATNTPNASLFNYCTLFYYYLCSYGYLRLFHVYDRNTIKWDATMHFFSTSHSVMPCWCLEISRGGGIYHRNRQMLQSKPGTPLGSPRPSILPPRSGPLEGLAELPDHVSSQ